MHQLALTYTVLCRVCVVYHVDLTMPKSCGPLPGLSMEKAYRTSVAQENIKIQNIKFSNYASNLHHCKAEKLKSSHSKLEIFCNSLNITGMLGLENKYQNLNRHKIKGVHCTDLPLNFCILPCPCLISSQSVILKLNGNKSPCLIKK